MVTGAFLASRLLGWLRIVVISQAFPDPPTCDPYLAAFRIPDLIYQLVAAGAVGIGAHPGADRAAQRRRGDAARLAGRVERRST